MNSSACCRRIRVVMVLVCAMLGTVAWGGADDVVISITDYTGRGFAPDCVNYRLDGTVDAKSTVLRDAAGKDVPFQVTKAGDGANTLSFIAEVALNQTATWTVSKGTPSAKGAVTVRTDTKALALANDRLSVCLPPVQSRTFETPVAADTLPAPIQSWTSRGSAPMGAAKILTKRLVKSLNVAVVTEGDVWSEAVYEIAWAAGGFYRCTVRVEDRVPMAKVTEEYDIGMLDGSDYWEINPLAGWTPDTLEEAHPAGNGGANYKGDIGDLTALSKRKPFYPMAPDLGNLGHFGLYSAAAMKANSDTAPMAGVLLLHRGSWRRSTALEVYSPEGGLLVRLPMSPRDTMWAKDLSSVTSPFSMHSFDKTLPATYGRRIWGLLLAPAELPELKGAKAIESPDNTFNGLSLFSRARSLYGVVGLDRYKDYVLDWPDSGLKYPRIWRAGMSPEAQRAALDKAPVAESAKAFMRRNFATFAAPEKRAETLASEWAAVRGRHLTFLANYFTTCPTPSHHTVSGSYAGAQMVDDLLAQPDTTPEQRRELRARTALLNYLFNEPDVMDFGSGQHPGNPNMGMARSFPGMAYVPLMADHPMYEAWRARVAEHAEYMLGSNMAPGGGWFEYGAAYHMHGFRVRHVLAAFEALALPNLALLFDYCRQDMAYFRDLLTPMDPRYGSRLVPGMANSAPGKAPAYIEAAAAFEKSDPAFAANLLAAWEENGGALEDAGNVPLNTTAKTPALASAHYPGIGVIFRAHQGPDETWMLLRNGFLWSHWYIDPGHFILFSRGGPLVPPQSYQYYTSPNTDFDMYNTVRFGSPKNQMPYGWPDSNILDYAFGGAVEYAWSSTGMPDWFITPGVSAPFREPVAGIPNSGARPLEGDAAQKEGAFEWDRQVFFLKGKTAKACNYFVFRDTTRGDGHLAGFLNLNLLGRKTDLAFNKGSVVADTEFGSKLDILFPGRPALDAALLEENQPTQFVGSNQPRKLDKDETSLSRNWIDAETGTPTADTKKIREQRVFMRIPAKPDEGYFWVLFPRDAKDAAPTVTLPAANVMKITHAEGTDYVFAGAEAFRYEGDGVAFEGKAGAVRLGKDAAVLSILSGAGTVRYGKQSLSGIGPIERSVPLSGEKAETVPAATYRIVLPTAAPEGWTLRTREAGTAMVRDAGVFMEGGAAAVLTKESLVRFIAPTAEYVKLTVGNVGIRGFGPFDLTFSPTGITGSVEGRTRSLVSTWPERITRPMYLLDGRRWYAGWADDPCIGKGTATPQFALAFAVMGGAQTLEVREWAFMGNPPAPQRRIVTLR